MDCQDSNFCSRSTQSKNVCSAPKIGLWMLPDVTVLWLWVVNFTWCKQCYDCTQQVKSGHLDMWINAYIDILHCVTVPISPMVNEYHMRGDNTYILYTFSGERCWRFFLIDYYILDGKNGWHFHENINICAWQIVNVSSY